MSAELTPAPLELVALAVQTAKVDEQRLTGWLYGHLDAGVPWPVLLRLVSLWLLRDGDRQLFELDDALTAWRLQHPHTRTLTNGTP